MSGLSFFPFVWAVVIGGFHCFHFFSSLYTNLRSRAHSHAQGRTVFLSSAPGLLFFAIFVCFFCI
ncbi:hypothetical protein BJY52DRAFT_1343224 [Lactarius psammicola]|nr:hypothetical protein BJY52DRAFT_1343224 [Lactarius psammicola]